MPCNWQLFVISQHFSLGVTLYGAAGYLDKDETVTFIIRSRTCDRIAIYAVFLHRLAVIIFAVEI